jgi:hypothetical protein
LNTVLGAAELRLVAVGELLPGRECDDSGDKREQADRQRADRDEKAEHRAPIDVKTISLGIQHAQTSIGVLDRVAPPPHVFFELRDKFGRDSAVARSVTSTAGFEKSVSCVEENLVLLQALVVEALGLLSADTIPIHEPTFRLGSGGFSLCFGFLFHCFGALPLCELLDDVAQNGSATLGQPNDEQTSVPRMDFHKLRAFVPLLALQRSFIER